MRPSVADKATLRIAQGGCWTSGSTSLARSSPSRWTSSASAGWLARWTEREKPLRAIRWTPTGSRAQLAIVPAGALGAQPEIFHDHFVETEEDTDVCGSVAFLFRGSSLVEGGFITRSASNSQVAEARCC
jgi:hypothetical protein